MNNKQIAQDLVKVAKELISSEREAGKVDVVFKVHPEDGSKVKYYRPKDLHKIPRDFISPEEVGSFDIIINSVIVAHLEDVERDRLVDEIYG